MPVKYIYFDTIDSTNNEAKRRIASGETGGTELIRAQAQTMGRGRQGKSFFSPKDTGIYMTVTIPLDCPIASQVTMTTRTAVAVAASLEELFHIVPSIKWVNDIYVDGLKCCGILCEAVNDYDTGLMKYAVIGVGINLSTKDWPEELRGIAGSIGAGLFDADEVSMKIAEKIVESFADLENRQYLEYYRSHSNVIGRQVTFTENGQTFEGFAKDIDENGGLIVDVKTDSGEAVRVLNSGEITLRSKQ